MICLVDDFCWFYASCFSFLNCWVLEEAFWFFWSCFLVYLSANKGEFFLFLFGSLLYFVWSLLFWSQYSRTILFFFLASYSGCWFSLLEWNEKWCYGFWLVSSISLFVVCCFILCSDYSSLYLWLWLVGVLV